MPSDGGCFCRGNARRRVTVECFYRRTARRCMTWCYCRGTARCRVTAGCFCGDFLFSILLPVDNCLQDREDWSNGAAPLVIDEDSALPDVPANGFAESSQPQKMLPTLTSSSLYPDRTSQEAGNSLNRGPTRVSDSLKSKSGDNLQFPPGMEPELIPVNPTASGEVPQLMKIGSGRKVLFLFFLHHLPHLTYHSLMNYVMTLTTSCSARLFAGLITCYIPSFRPHLAHHKDTICENERIYCNYLTIPHTCQTKIASLTCYIKTHTRTRYSSLPLQCYM